MSQYDLYDSSSALGKVFEHKWQYNVDIKLNKKHEDAVLPTQSKDDVGFDLYAIESGVIGPNSSAKIDTGLCFAEPIDAIGNYKVFAKMEGRSGLASKSIFPIGGIIDPSYRGLLKVVLYNGSQHLYEYKKGDKIAQLVLYTALFNSENIKVNFVETDEIKESDRGDKGFGSSGR